MVWGAVAAIGAQIGANLYNDYRDRKAQKREYKYNSWLQEDNQAFQKYMAENAHQMEMEDLKKAGLNPALSATGSSASSIAGSSAAQGTSDANSAQIDVEKIVDSINSLRQTNADIDKKTAETANIETNTLATIEMLPLSKKEKEALIKFTNERARGITNSSSYSGNFGNKLVGGGGSYSNTTVR